MKIISMSWVRNEADIIEHVARYYAGIVDHMVFVDNASEDATPDILESLRREGLPLTIRHDPSHMHRQDGALTDLMHELADTEQPDFLLPFDADECIAGDGSDDIRSLLLQASAETITLLPWHTYVPLDTDDASEPNPFRRIVNRRALEEPQYYKVLIPRAFHGAAFGLCRGNHALKYLSTGEPVPSAVAEHLFMSHFPVRSAEQIMRKATQGWQRNLARPNVRPGESFHWAKMVESFEENPHITPQRLASLALQYAQPRDMKGSDAVILDPLL
jgi:hypothetical protein